MDTLLIRKCSVCSKPGHTKRKCAVFDKPVANYKKSSGKTVPVLVQVTPDVKKSQHFIDLRNLETKSHWDSISVYEEKSVGSNKSHTLNIAELVKKVNEEKARHWRLEMKAVAKQVQKKNDEMYKKPHISFESFVWKAFSRRPRSVELKEQKAEPVMVFHWKKAGFAAMALLLVVAVPLPAVGYYHKLKDVNGLVVEESTDAFLALQASTIAALQSNIGQAEQDLSTALQAFGRANSLVEKEYQLILSVAKLIPVVGTHVSSRQNLLLAGHHLALGNTYLVKGIGEVENMKDEPLTQKLSVLKRHLQSSLPQYKEALELLSQVDDRAIPVNYQQPFKEFTLLFGTFVNDLEDLVNLAGAMETIFGSDSFKRYLVVFQNNHELRATGGFMGSFAVVDVQKGKILNIDIPGGGTYDVKGQLSEYVKPPLPLQLVNKRWEFQDANWFPDFSASAQKMSWFYENSRGTTVDGVIALNASVLERVFKVLGPINNNEYDLLLDHENVIDELQYQVEVAFDKKENKPKAILAGLLEQLLGSVKELESTQVLQLLSEVHGAVQEKEIQIYMEDQVVQKQLREFGWTGELLVPNSEQDYLLVSYTNVQGQKSDAKIKQEISHQAVIDEEGYITDTVTIKRTHFGEVGEQFYGVPNIGYLRTYVPEGAVLLEAGGFTFPPEEAFKVPETWYKDDPDLAFVEKDKSIHVDSGTVITNEFGKTAFGNWVLTMPGEMSEVYLTYKLPFKVPVQKSGQINVSAWKTFINPEINTQTSRYSIVAQKQSGIESSFKSVVIFSEDWTPVWKSSEEVGLAMNGSIYETTLDTDKVVGVVVEKK